MDNNKNKQVKPEIKQFKIISEMSVTYSDCISRLERNLNDELLNGWVPQGGISVTHTDRGYFASIILAKLF